MAYLAGTRLGYRPTVRGGGGTGFVAANPTMTSRRTSGRSATARSTCPARGSW